MKLYRPPSYALNFLIKLLFSQTCLVIRIWILNLWLSWSASHRMRLKYHHVVSRGFITTADICHADQNICQHLKSNNPLPCLHPFYIQHTVPSWILTFYVKTLAKCRLKVLWHHNKSNKRSPILATGSCVSVHQATCMFVYSPVCVHYRQQPFSSTMSSLAARTTHRITSYQKNVNKSQGSAKSTLRTLSHSSKSSMRCVTSFHLMTQ